MYANTHAYVLLIEPDVLIQGLQHLHLEPAELQEHAFKSMHSDPALLTSRLMCNRSKNKSFHQILHLNQNWS